MVMTKPKAKKNIQSEIFELKKGEFKSNLENAVHNMKRVSSEERRQIKVS